MAETFEQYTQRIVAYTTGKDPIAMQREVPELIAELIHGVALEKLMARPAPGKWSVTEIIAHLADDEITSYWRYRQMLEHPGLPLNGFDQDLWAQLGDYGSWDPHEALELFRLLRGSNLRMLAKLTPEQWESSGIHEERGRLTVRELAQHLAGHDRNHLDQIMQILGTVRGR
jgi:hypothetical protein